jgi:hypothetical protein
MRTMILLAAGLVLSLSGCMSRPQSVTDAENAAIARVENYAKNQQTIIAGYRDAYIEEAKGHIETRKDWSVDIMDQAIKSGKKADDTPVTPDDIKAGYADVYRKRDLALFKVAQEIAAATAAQATAEKDLSNARRLWAGVRTYDETPALTLDAVPVFVQLLTPLVDPKAAKVEVPANGQ